MSAGGQLGAASVAEAAETTAAWMHGNQSSSTVNNTPQPPLGQKRLVKSGQTIDLHFVKETEVVQSHLQSHGIGEIHLAGVEDF